MLVSYTLILRLALLLFTVFLPSVVAPNRYEGPLTPISAPGTNIDDLVYHLYAQLRSGPYTDSSISRNDPRLTNDELAERFRSPSALRRHMILGPAAAENPNLRGVALAFPVDLEEHQNFPHRTFGIVSVVPRVAGRRLDDVEMHVHGYVFVKKVPGLENWLINQGYTHADNLYKEGNVLSTDEVVANIRRVLQR